MIDNHLTPFVMFSREMRELERQASVVTVRKQNRHSVLELPVGSYMERNSVLNYLYHAVCKSTLASMVESRCDVYVTNTEFIPTSQIKIYMIPSLFREMECSVPTLTVSR
jgi:hypothetical protein